MKMFGKTIRSQRKAKDLTQQYVADRVGVMKGYICQLELAAVDPPAPDKVRKLAKVLGLNKAELLLMAYVSKAPIEIRRILRSCVDASRLEVKSSVMVTR